MNRRLHIRLNISVLFWVRVLMDGHLCLGYNSESKQTVRIYNQWLR